MKFVHTADWHIGMKFSSFEPSQAQKARQARLDAGKLVVRLANENRAEFIVIAGDLFHDNAVERRLVSETANILSKFNGRVFIIPGNHDPLVPGSVWDHSPSWKDYDNITIFRESAPYDIHGCVLYPCVPTAKYNSKDPTSWVDASAQSQISIGIAHGNVDALKDEATDIPISVNAADRTGLDYLALGHWHSPVLYGQSGVKRMAYSGAHERGGFGEKDSGYALLVQIDERMATPSIETIPTGILKWERKEYDVGLEGDLLTIGSEISNIHDPQHTILSVIISGFLYPETIARLDRLVLEWKNTFMSLGIDVSRMRPAPDDDSWLESLPVGIVRDTAADLKKMSEVPGRNGEVALVALMELYKMSHEAPR